MARIEKGRNDFKTTGLYPIDTNVFKEEDFIPLLDLATATVIYMNIPILVVLYTSPSAIISLVAGPSDWTSINQSKKINTDLKNNLPKIVRTLLRTLMNPANCKKCTKMTADDKDKTIQIQNKSFEEIYPTPKYKPGQSIKKYKSKI